MTKYYKLKTQWLGGEVTLKADTKVWFEQDSEQWYMCFHEGRIKIVKYVLDADVFSKLFEEIKEEQPFQWSDELAEEFAKQYRFSSSRISLQMFKEGKGFPIKQQTNTILSGEKYKQWDIPMNATIKESQPKTERIEVKTFRKKEDFFAWYEIYTGKQQIPEEKFPLIKQAIEKTLNNE